MILFEYSLYDGDTIENTSNHMEQPCARPSLSLSSYFFIIFLAFSFFSRALLLLSRSRSYKCKGQPRPSLGTWKFVTYILRSADCPPGNISLSILMASTDLPLSDLHMTSPFSDQP